MKVENEDESVFCAFKFKDFGKLEFQGASLHAGIKAPFSLYGISFS